MRQSEYPNLARMARDYLAIPGTGVPVERLFSTGPDLLSPRRQSLKPQTIKECLCLKNGLQHQHNIEQIHNQMKKAVEEKVFGAVNP